MNEIIKMVANDGLHVAVGIYVVLAYLGFCFIVEFIAKKIFKLVKSIFKKIKSAIAKTKPEQTESEA